MMFLGLNALVSTWLLLSAFVLPHTPGTAAMTAIAAFAVLLFAALAAGRPAARYVITAIAVALGVTALLLPGLTGAAAISNAIVGAVLAALSLFSPVHAAPSKPATDPSFD
jgi:predicted exporter